MRPYNGFDPVGLYTEKMQAIAVFPCSGGCGKAHLNESETVPHLLREGVSSVSLQRDASVLAGSVCSRDKTKVIQHGWR